MTYSGDLAWVIFWDAFWVVRVRMMVDGVGDAGTGVDWGRVEENTPPAANFLLFYHASVGGDR